MIATSSLHWMRSSLPFHKQFLLYPQHRHSQNSQVHSFLVRGFFLYLTFTPHAFFLSPASSISTLRGPVTFSFFSNPVKAPRVITLSSLWVQWGSFFSVTASLARARVTFLWGGSSDLFHFSHSLSWFSWRASFVAWRLYSTTRQIPLQSVSSFFCTLFFSDSKTSSKTSSAQPCPKTQVPLLGVGDFTARWASWAYVYSATTSRPLQLLFLGCVAKSLALMPLELKWKLLLFFWLFSV